MADMHLATALLVLMTAKCRIDFNLHISIILDHMINSVVFIAYSKKILYLFLNFLVILLFSSDFTTSSGMCSYLIFAAVVS